MRHSPEDEDDQKHLDQLNAEQWQVDLLKLNPDYCAWGIHEDYMIKPNSKGWDSPIEHDSWGSFDIGLGDLNEVVNFYFELSRKAEDCNCSSGYHPDASWVADSFYRHSSPFKNESMSSRETKVLLQSFSEKITESHFADLGVASFPSEETLSKYGSGFREFCESMRDGDGRWSNKITEDEFEYLKEKGRSREYSSYQECNDKEDIAGLGSHDGINRMFLIEKRLERFGIPETCTKCEGHAYVYTADIAHVNLNLWLLHPRKGCSRGVEIRNILENDLPSVFEFLRTARRRNESRFALIPGAVQ